MLLFPTIVCVLCTKLSKSLCIFFTLLDQQSIFSLPGSYLFHSFIHLSSKVYLLLHILSSYHLLYYILGINIYTYTLLFYLKIKKDKTEREIERSLSYLYTFLSVYERERNFQINRQLSDKRQFLQTERIGGERERENRRHIYTGQSYSENRSQRSRYKKQIYFVCVQNGVQDLGPILKFEVLKEKK